MADPYQFPKLRAPLEARFETIGEQRVILLRCPLGITTQPLLLNDAVAPLLACFQGQDSVATIVSRFASVGATEAIVRELVSLLDSHFFLETPAFKVRQARALSEYHLMEIRHPALAGLSYAPTEELLRREIDGYLGGAITEKPDPATSPVIGLVSPHIDYRRGGSAYGHAYRMMPSKAHDLILLMGTSHQYSERLFHLTRKHFATPLGTLSNERLFVDALASLHGKERSFEDEILHRQEHSLELQTPFLVRRNVTAPIVPILVGSFHGMVAQGNRPESIEEYQSFVGALTHILRLHLAEKKTFCIVAGVDMAHVGRYFGDKEPLSDDRLAYIHRRDAEYLHHIQQRDLTALFSHIAEDNDARKICGFPTLYTALDVLTRLGESFSTKILDYQQAVNRSTDCCVTFASAVLTRTS